MSRQYLRHPGPITKTEPTDHISRSTWARATIGVLFAFFLIALIVGLSSCSGNDAPTGHVSPIPTGQAQPKTTTTHHHHVVVKHKTHVTVGQYNAIRKAKLYLSISGFSKKGLEAQLVFDKFSTADAKYAVNHVGANWNNQAVRKGKSYMDLTGFSKPGLVGQLEFDKFTHAQAVYAANKIFKN